MKVTVSWVAAHVVAYLLGSLPVALWVTYWLTRKDVRTLGDGNMGARNVSHVLGWWPAALVAVADVAKGMLAVKVGHVFGLSGPALYTVGMAAVLGHDFPIFAGLRGGQGMATLTGISLMLLPLEALIGLAVLGLVYLVTRSFNLSAALGLGTLAFLAWYGGQPPSLLLFIVFMLLSIPLKKWADRHRVQPVLPDPAPNGSSHIRHNGRC